PSPAQVSVYSTAPTEAAAMFSLPAAGLVPTQPPDAIQEVTLFAVHDNAIVLPSATTSELAFNASVGGDAATVTDALRETVPPAPVHSSENVAAPGATPVTLWLPEGDLLPLQAPEAVQDEALVLDQARL